MYTEGEERRGEKKERKEEWGAEERKEVGKERERLTRRELSLRVLGRSDPPAAATNVDVSTKLQLTC